MKNIDSELVEWAVNKIKSEYREDVSLLIGQVGGGKIPTDEQNMAFDFFVPATERGNRLARTFIIEDMGYDLYPISWERLEGIANIEEPRMIFAFVKGEVIYARSEQERARYEKLKAKLLERLQDERLQAAKSMEFLETAQEIYQTMLFDDSLCNVRKAAGGVCCYLMNAIAIQNGTYLESGYMNLTRDLHTMKEYPQEFETIFRDMLAMDQVEEIREQVRKLIRLTRIFLMGKLPPEQTAAPEPNYDDLAMWYQEMRYTFRRLRYYTETGSGEDSYLLGCYLQIEFDAVQEDFGLKRMDLMSFFDDHDLRAFAGKAEEIEAYLIRTLEEHQASRNSYGSLGEFLEADRHSSETLGSH